MQDSPLKVAGVDVAEIRPIPWTSTDDRCDGWTIVGRASVFFANGGLANGLLVERNTWSTVIGGPERLRRVVLWERPPGGGVGRFVLLPVVGK